MARAEERREAADDIAKAWAIVQPYPGKAKLMASRFAQIGCETCVPEVLQQRGNGALVAVPMYATYVFVRPPVGRRHRALYESFDRPSDRSLLANVLERVLFDDVISLVLDCAREHNNVKSEERLNEIKARAPKTLRSLSDLQADDFIATVDKANLDDLFRKLERFGVYASARIEDYIRTDDLA